MSFEIQPLVVGVTEASRPDCVDIFSVQPLSGFGIADPSSQHCTSKGGKIVISGGGHTAQSADCVFPDGSRCEAWAFYRGECGPSPSNSPLWLGLGIIAWGLFFR